MPDSSMSGSVSSALTFSISSRREVYADEGKQRGNDT